MLNGAVTLGTVDGANVEIMESVGKENIFTFGLTASEVAETWTRGYYASNYFTDNSKTCRIAEALKTGFDGESFADISNYLVLGGRQIADPYMCLADFEDYLRAAKELDAAYRDPLNWNKISLLNIAAAGRFSSDRSIKEYAENIWGLKPVTLKKK
jgi:starch phosphorylase